MAFRHKIDEETPLLQNQPKKRTPLPWIQLTIILLLQLGEPLTSQAIYPFAPQLVRGLGITGGDESKVGFYVGIIESLFFLAEACTVLHWSRLSDRVGRKPVILIGVFGLSMSMYCFGLSTTFCGLLLSRALSGALNGNVGVMKSMVAELTDSTNITQALAYMPMGWYMGATFGPIIGGSLSQPAERFPGLFGNNEFLRKYPYFLPCAVPATYTACALLVAYFLLQETVKHPTPFRDVFLRSQEKKKPYSIANSQIAVREYNNESPSSLRSLLTSNVIIVGANYALLSLVDIAFLALEPLFFFTPVELGGLGLPPSTIGNILGASGVLTGCFQIFFFARIHEYWGSKTVFVAGITSAIPLFLSFPIINYVAQARGYTPTLWIIVGAQLFFSMMLSLSYGAVFIFMQAASPNRASLGATNGLCQVLVSVMRAIGPATTNSLFSLSIAQNYLDGYLVYYILLVLVGVALFVASLLPSSTVRA